MYKIIIAFHLCSTSLLSFGQEVFSIEQAKEYAVSNNVNIINAQADIDIAQQQIIETRGIGLPQVAITGQFNHFINQPVQVIDANFFNPNAADGETISFTAGTKFSAQGALQVNQMIFNGSYIIGLKASNFFKKFQNTVAKQTTEQTIFNVIQSYEMAAIAKENLVFMDSLVIVSQKMVDKQQNIVDAGIGLQEDLDQLMYSLLVAKNSHSMAENSYRNSLSMLKLSMGFDIKSEIEISDTPETLLSKTNISFGNIENNLSYTLLSEKIVLSELNMKNYKFQNLPTLNAFFSQTYSAYRNNFDFFANERWFPQTLWGLQLNVPIFSGLTRHAQTQQAKIALMKDQNSLKLLEQSLSFQESQLRNNLITAKSQMELQAQNVELAQKLYNNEILKESIGKGNSIFVTQKHNQLLAAQTQYTQSTIAVFEARLELDKLYNNILSK